MPKIAPNGNTIIVLACVSVCTQVPSERKLEEEQKGKNAAGWIQLHAMIIIIVTSVAIVVVGGVALAVALVFMTIHCALATASLIVTPLNIF